MNTFTTITICAVYCRLASESGTRKDVLKKYVDACATVLRCQEEQAMQLREADDAVEYCNRELNRLEMVIDQCDKGPRLLVQQQVHDLHVLTKRVGKARDAVQSLWGNMAAHGSAPLPSNTPVADRDSAIDVGASSELPHLSDEELDSEDDVDEGLDSNGEGEEEEEGWRL